jgi:hypothetical protein
MEHTLKSRNPVRAALGAAALLMLSGCASITESPWQSITLETDPTEARCAVSRQGESLGAVDKTPGTLKISKAFRALRVACEKPGYAPEVADVPSSMQPMTFGNILIGGGIGFGIDAMTGAMRFYPSNVRVILAPAEFESAQARDAFFAERAKNLEQAIADAAARTREACRAESCEAEARKIEATKQAQLDELDRRRVAAKVKQ